MTMDESWTNYILIASGALASNAECVSFHKKAPRQSIETTSAEEIRRRSEISRKILFQSRNTETEREPETVNRC